MALHLFDFEGIKSKFNQINSMRTRSNSIFLLVVLALTILQSCEGLLEEVFADPFLDSGTEVITHTPELYEDRVIFNGELKNLPSRTQVEYGFMWFKSGDESNITRIPIGKRTSSGSFKATSMTLPRGENLVVCAYAALVEDQTFEAIGEERDFYWGF